MSKTEWSVKPYQALIAGAFAGISVDTALYPLDTIKTRLQSSDGFLASGGFRGIYSGLSSVIVGAAPGAAMFFMSYETAKYYTNAFIPKENSSKFKILSHMISASLAEVGACLIRVPTERVKQNIQTGKFNSLHKALFSIYSNVGFLGFYRGFGTTVLREIPFSLIQFPLYELLKVKLRDYVQRTPNPWEIGLFCGSTSGAFAAAVTTPLDVIKTRIMLSGLSKDSSSNPTMRQIVGAIYKEGGLKAFYKGIGPRVIWISMGGFIFLGVYEQALCIISNQQH